LMWLEILPLLMGDFYLSFQFLLLPPFGWSSSIELVIEEEIMR